MTRDDLKELKYLKTEIKLLEDELDNIEYVYTKDSVRGSMANFPYIQTHFKIQGIDIQDYDKKVNRIKGRITKRVNELLSLLEKADEYIYTIDSSLIRQAIILKYIKCLTWDQVAAQIGQDHTADSIRKVVERFFKSQ